MIVISETASWVLQHKYWTTHLLAAVMVMAVGDPVAADVVFLVEATTNLESSFNDMKSNYITQILNHFNPAFNDDPDMAIDVSIVNKFSYWDFVDDSYLLTPVCVRCILFHFAKFSDSALDCIFHIPYDVPRSRISSSTGVKSMRHSEIKDFHQEWTSLVR